ncbi:tyrosine--tRNA ligase [Desulfosoma caldarium]|uniref:Tyrosine--tRNA ligase n=1 Tax=Desulfosoma caldarium TaxID=610254 RepID=A0A3N1VN32_9BACT|nr:tyrosine--tRNA ligase [Desulfosoma caldarium]ROR03469.1 tyrosyl-tRNA synthetase [Desulfosoma caldarium]
MTPVKNALDILTERGFVEQVTDREALRERLSKPMTCYIGFDPTADSLHVGSLVPIMALVHMQRSGHRPIVLVGGGTGMVGDPSGRTEMRQMLMKEQIEHNVQALKIQLSRFLDFAEGKALLLNNADWLMELRYIDFLRDIGRHFSVNRMLAAESYRARLETGLNFIEFNYMLLQAYDFYHLAKTYGCFLQMGGNDQWGNIVAGIDLIRKKLHQEAFGITFPLLTTATGAKMGKTAAGAVWLSAQRTSPYDFYQYWINVDDRDVVRFLKLYTLLPVEEIDAVSQLEGEQLNAAKSVLAYEVTCLVHGRQAAEDARRAALRVFGGRRLPENLLPSSTVSRDADSDEGSVPTVHVERSRMETGVPAFELFADAGLCESRSAARRLIQQGGAYVNGRRLERFDALISLDWFKDGAVLLRAGKKKVRRVSVAP